MSVFTRDDEKTLDLLRARREHATLRSDEVETLRQLEERYSAFIREGLQNLYRMAPRSSRLRRVLASWPLLWLLLCLHFVALCLAPLRGQWPLDWHPWILGALLAATLVVGLTRLRELRWTRAAVLTSCVVAASGLSVATLIAARGTVASDVPDPRLLYAIASADAAVAVMAALLIFVGLRA